jgi:phosphate transport system permease protein
VKNLQARYWRDRLLVALLIALTALVLVPLFLFLGYAVIHGIGALDLAFFTRELRPPTVVDDTGLSQAIVGTLIVDGIALLLAIPIGIAAGIMLSEYPDHPLNPALRILNDTLNGMPAIVKGLVAFALIVRPMGTFSGFAGAVALAFVMIPIIGRATEGVLRLIPWEIREAALALGLPRWRVVLSTVLPAASAGLVTGILLAFARAAGEAAPLLFTSFGNQYMNLDPSRAMDTLPLRIYRLATSPYTHWHDLAWAGALVLLAFIMLASALARLAIRQRH